MAGVGFGLRSLASGDSLTSTLRAYGSASIIGSGPWLISILTMLFVGIVGRRFVPDPEVVSRFQVAVTWLFFISLVLSGPLQLSFTRFMADRLYEERDDLVLPNLLGSLLVMSIASVVLYGVCKPLLGTLPLQVQLLLLAGLAVLCAVWMVVTALSAVRRHDLVFLSFALGYGVTFVATLALASRGLPGLLMGFLVGQGTLLFSALWAIGHSGLFGRGVRLDFLTRGNRYWDLALVGLFFNAGVWVDKVLFWFEPLASQAVLGPLRSSEVYDLPLFLAYLTMVPGMAVFLVRVETDYAESHQAFYRAIEKGASLKTIEDLREAMTAAARRGIADIYRVQGMTFAIALVAGPGLLRLAGISELHLPLFFVDTAAVALQVLLLSIISILFYLDRRRAVLGLVVALFCSNLAFTWLSQQLGAAYFGYGFAAAAALTTVLSLLVLNRALANLVRDTFMLQPVGV